MTTTGLDRTRCEVRIGWSPTTGVISRIAPSLELVVVTDSRA